MSGILHPGPMSVNRTYGAYRQAASKVVHSWFAGRLTSPISPRRVFPETSIHKCKVRNFPLGHPGPDTRSASGFHGCREGQFHPGPKLPAVQPLRSQRAQPRGPQIEVHRTGEFESCHSREYVRFSASLSPSESESPGVRCKDQAMRNALPRLELARVGLANSRDFPKERENTCRGTFYTGCDG